jgi:TRAP-type C4-dicarboxylate transport system permease large subunit
VLLRHEQLRRTDNAAVGVVLNVVGSVARVPLSQVITGVWPFLIAQIVLIFLLVMFPQLVMIPFGWLY